MTHPLRSLAAPALAALLAGCQRSADARAPAAAPAEAAPAWSAPAGAPALTAALGRGGAHLPADVAVDAAGALHAVFSADATGDGRGDAVWYARLDGGAWSPAVRLAEGTAPAELPRVAVDGVGRPVVLWYAAAADSARAPAVELAYRAWDGRDWTPRRAAYREAAPSGIPRGSLAAAADRAGRVHVLHRAAGHGFGHLVWEGGRWRGPDLLDHDGFTAEWAAGPAPSAEMEAAYVGDMVTRERRRTVNDVFVRSRRGGRWRAPVEAYFDPSRHSHYPQLAVDARGVRHLFWLEDRTGDVVPEALLHATSPDGEGWSPAADVTPAELRGGVLWMVKAAADARGRIHLAVRRGGGVADTASVVQYLRFQDGAVAESRPLVAPREMGMGDVELAFVPARAEVVALWRGRDGEYRTARLDAR